MKARTFLSDFLKAICAGGAISVGGAVFLSLFNVNKTAGAFIFAVGLFTVLFYKFNLFTGKVGYLVNEKPRYLLFLLTVLIGNLAGTLAVGLLLRLGFGGESALVTAGVAVSEAKLALPLYMVFIRAIFCGVLMYLAVDGYKRLESGILKAVAVFLGVGVFIICGFEHCVADMFYFTAGAAWSPYTALWILVAVLGNSAGSAVFALCMRVFEPKKPA